jgi:hypothetical protein
VLSRWISGSVEDPRLCHRKVESDDILERREEPRQKEFAEWSSEHKERRETKGHSFDPLFPIASALEMTTTDVEVL